MTEESREQPEIRSMVLTFICKDDQVALGIKARKIGEGLWNGFGGSVEPTDEDLQEAAVREVKEEVGVDIANPEYRGSIDFHRKGKINRVHMFTAAEFAGDFEVNAEEISEVKWFAKDNLPWDQMLLGDPYWLPQVLEGKQVSGEVHYSEDWELVKHEVKEEHRLELISK